MLLKPFAVDELDEAIYRYYEHFKNSVTTSSNDKHYSRIARAIGKSFERVRKAIDRYEFKQSDPCTPGGNTKDLYSKNMLDIHAYSITFEI